MAKASTRVTGNDPVADPGGTRGKPAKTDKTTETVKSGDRNDNRRSRKRGSRRSSVGDQVCLGSADGFYFHADPAGPDSCRLFVGDGGGGAARAWPYRLQGCRGRAGDAAGAERDDPGRRRAELSGSGGDQPGGRAAIGGDGGADRGRPAAGREPRVAEDAAHPGRLRDRILPVSGPAFRASDAACRQRRTHRGAGGGVCGPWAAPGVDLLAYRATEAAPLDLVRAARRGLGDAGAVDLRRRGWTAGRGWRRCGRRGADAFTVGSAAFDLAFSPAAGLAGQLAAIRACA